MKEENVPSGVIVRRLHRAFPRPGYTSIQCLKLDEKQLKRLKVLKLRKECVDLFLRENIIDGEVVKRWRELMNLNE